MALAEGGAPARPQLELSDFGCPICLNLLYKPAVNPGCGHAFCFSCLFKAMSPFADSHCPLCRREFGYLPAVRVGGSAAMVLCAGGVNPGARAASHHPALRSTGTAASTWLPDAPHAPHRPPTASACPAVAGRSQDLSSPLSLSPPFPPTHSCAPGCTRRWRCCSQSHTASGRRRKKEQLRSGSLTSPPAPR